MNFVERKTQIVDAFTARRHRPDYVLPLICLLLLVIGLVVVFAISPALAAQKNVNDSYFVGKQVTAILLGLVSFVVVGNLRPDIWRKFEKPLLVTALFASLAVRLFGEQINGAYRWVQIGGLSFQAAELIKFALIVWLAGFLNNRIQRGLISDWNQTFKPLLIAMGAIVLVVTILQSDLGSSAVMVVIVGAMSFVAGLPMKRLIPVAIIVLLGLSLTIATSDYRRSRLQTFFNPTSDCQGAGYQSCQALIAVGSGGMFGLGLGHSVQAYGYLPEAANDSIFAIYAEKFGFIGSAILLGLFIALFGRIMKTLERAPDDYTRLLVAGVFAWLSTQAIINIGAMVGLLPLKGITLPFISYGGTSLIFVTAAIGLVFSVSRYTSYRTSAQINKGVDHDDSIGRRRQRRSYNATVSRRT